MERVARVNEAAIQAQIVEFLSKAGWYVREFSQDKPARGKLPGFPDVEAFRQGTTLLIETKTMKGKTRTKQIEFAENIRLHLADTLRYIKARSLDDVLKALE